MENCNWEGYETEVSLEMELIFTCNCSSINIEVRAGASLTCDDDVGICLDSSIPCLTRCSQCYEQQERPPFSGHKR